MEPKVFISHSTRDKAMANAICKTLESAGIRCWIAPRDIEPGADWTEGIMRGITGCRAFVLVFADGVQDEILNDLAKIAQLTVVSRTSVMQYRADEKRDVRQIANALGVSNLLEGTVRRAGNRVRVSTELIDARQDKTIWADSFDRDLTDIFAIQSEVAETIAYKLAATLSPEEKGHIEKKPTENLEAYDLYLQANELLVTARVNLNFGDISKPMLDAIALLDRALRLDPKFTLAYCALADAQGYVHLLYDPTEERRASAEAALKSAQRLEPDLPEVQLAYARNLYRFDRDFERARVTSRSPGRGYQTMPMRSFLKHTLIAGRDNSPKQSRSSTRRSRATRGIPSPSRS